jgi:hypothetical protein
MNGGGKMRIINPNQIVFVEEETSENEGALGAIASAAAASHR